MQQQPGGNDGLIHLLDETPQQLKRGEGNQAQLELQRARQAAARRRMSATQFCAVVCSALVTILALVAVVLVVVLLIYLAALAVSRLEQAD